MLSWSAISIRHRVLNEIARARNSPHAQYIDSARAVVLAIRNCPSLALPTPPPNVNIRRPEMLQHHHHKLAVDLQPLQSPAARNEMGVARPQFAQTPEAPKWSPPSLDGGAFWWAPSDHPRAGRAGGE
ncbi:hypothetical protein CDV36_003417 [Fusarium kuroshium]|uniref:Uncharacterized protein n=3 Tax=Fusarium solani species complex TaxID=232080 RepID=A0A3M2SH53_9HYPO|nr:hypothetical protein CDV36_003417 [Fusarium kuroshium]RSL81108.1 hypothetical protein CEP51_006070 [Fusarium floridanum]RSM16440.1 hypothetical protein CEP52_000326 [Fusarium oligoseptatum]